MKELLLLISMLSLCPVTAVANAILNTYSSQSSFLSAVLPGSYQQTFSTRTTSTTLNYSGNGYSYTVKSTSPDLLQTAYGWLQETATNDTITITFTSGVVTALGADFFAVNLAAQPASTTVTLNFGGGLTRSFTSAASSTSFTGYIFDTPLTSLTYSAQSSGLNFRYPALDNLVVGTATPEPGTGILLSAVALLTVAVFSRRPDRIRS
jgi:hypothetical protein